MGLLDLPSTTEHLIPHKDSMKFIHTLEKYGPLEAETTVTIEDNMFLEKGGQLDPIVLAEFMAQLTAAHSGYESLLKKTGNKLGFLVGIKDFQVFRSVGKNDVLIVRAALVNDLHPFYFIEGEVLMHDTRAVVAKGVIKIWEYSEESNDVLNRSVAGNKPEKRFAQSQLFPSLAKNAGKLSQAIIDHILNVNYNAETKEGDAELFFDPDFTGFDGHFPAISVLPGVILVKTGKIMAEIMLQKSLVVDRLDNAKFNKIVFPGQTLHVSCRLTDKAPKIQLQCKLSTEGKTCATFIITAESYH